MIRTAKTTWTILTTGSSGCMQIYNEITTAEIMLESDTILPRTSMMRKTTKGRKKYRGLLPATANRPNR